MKTMLSLVGYVLFFVLTISSGNPTSDTQANGKVQTPTEGKSRTTLEDDECNDQDARPLVLLPLIL